MATTDNIYWINFDALLPRCSPSEFAGLGHIAIMARPRAGDWLEDEVAGWKVAGIDRVVSLLEPDEVVELGLEAEAGFCGRVGIELASFPIVDRGVPVSLPAAADLAHSVTSALRGGRNVAIHCRAGTVGRHHGLRDGCFWMACRGCIRSDRQSPRRPSARHRRPA